MSVLGVDIGTAGCKAVALNPAGEIISRASCQYPMITPRPGWAELDAQGVWEAVLEVLTKVSAEAGTESVQAISVSAMGDTVTPCDQDFTPLANSILAFDTRNTAEALEMEEKFGRKELFQITGQPTHPSYSITKILWIKKNQPELFAKAAYYLCYEDLITARLCGRPVSSYSTAARTMAMNILSCTWQPEILDFCGLEEQQLPLLAEAGSIAGKIQKEIAERLGLSAEVMIVVGGHDQPCGALGCGLFEKGSTLDSTGTVEVLLVTHPRPILTDEMLAANICFWPHVLPNQYCTCGQILTAGAAFRWFRDHFAQLQVEKATAEKIDPYDLITSEFSDGPSDVLFIPHLAGSGTPEFSPYAKGAMFGMTLNTSQKDMAKAILEGINFELKLNIELLEKAGMAVESLRTVGGAANSKVWMQLKADITGKTIQASQFADQCPRGAALLAGFGIGLFPNLKSTSDYCQRQFIEYEPNAALQEIYAQRYQDYLRFRSSIFGLYKRV